MARFFYTLPGQSRQGAQAALYQSERALSYVAQRLFLLQCLLCSYSPLRYPPVISVYPYIYPSLMNLIYFYTFILMNIRDFQLLFRNFLQNTASVGSRRLMYDPLRTMGDLLYLMFVFMFSGNIVFLFSSFLLFPGFYFPSTDFSVSSNAVTDFPVSL